MATRRKFETNVATELPKTRTGEPTLPWKLNDEDLDRLGAQDGSEKAADIASPPLKTRAIFPILLVLTIFVLLSQIVLNAYIENNGMQQSAAKKARELAALKADLAQAADEKNRLSENAARLGENAARLEKKIEDLKEQKELFTAALESLTKKNDEIVIEAPAVPAAPAEKK